jgi:hypothetical protein
MYLCQSGDHSVFAVEINTTAINPIFAIRIFDRPTEIIKISDPWISNDGICTTKSDTTPFKTKLYMPGNDVEFGI